MSTEAFNKRTNMGDDLIITADEIKKLFLFGVDLSDDDGNDFPDEMFEFYIRGAQNWVEVQLGGLILCERDIVEYQDYYINDYEMYGFIKLKKMPVQSVSELAMNLPLSSAPTIIDPKWYRPESVGAQMNIVPAQGTFSSILLGQGGGFLPILYSGIPFIPQFWKITYKAGFKKNEFPPLLREVIGMRAALGPLNVAGDLIAGAGISSKSLGMDGLSQSISTTASATNSGYGARILQYTKHIEKSMAHLKEYYTGIQMTVG
jgi:hypothetical protein